jgi:hypothetical protein
MVELRHIVPRQVWCKDGRREARPVRGVAADTTRTGRGKTLTLPGIGENEGAEDGADGSGQLTARMLGKGWHRLDTARLAAVPVREVG